MKWSLVRSWVFTLAVLFSATLFGQNAPKPKFFSTDSLVADFAKLPPEIQFFMGPAGPLNKVNGVIGSFGPLGTLGPYGDNPWNVTPYMRGAGNWQAFQETLARLGGPLSENGPYLLTTEFGQGFLDLWSTTYPQAPATRLFQSLRAGSPLHILGDAGPLGALSVMGPGGPNGATGFEQLEEGDFVNEDGKVVHSIDVKTTDGPYEAPLYELYKKNGRAKSEDSFFGVLSSVKRSRPKETISFTSNRNQWVSILLVGDYTLDDFELTLRGKGKSEPIAVSSHSVLNNFIVFQAPEGTDYEVDVKLKSSLHILPEKKFRLFVTGSTEKATSFGGEHLRSFSPERLHFNSKGLKALSSRRLGKKSCAQLLTGLLPSP